MYFNHRLEKINKYNISKKEEVNVGTKEMYKRY
jgi:hypothetical protein